MERRLDRRTEEKAIILGLIGCTLIMVTCYLLLWESTHNLVLSNTLKRTAYLEVEYCSDAVQQ